MKSALIAAISLCVSLSCVGEETISENLAKITKLEAAGKWEEALPIYGRTYKEMSLALDGLTVRFILRKGICELRCSRFNDAEQSFALILKERSLLAFHEPDKMRAMIYLSEVYARNNKPDLARKALQDTDQFFSSRNDLASENGLIDWRKFKVKQINDLLLRSVSPER